MMAKRNKPTDISPDMPLQLENHKRPFTRREFLGAGLVWGSAMVMAPSFLSLLSRSAYAVDPIDAGSLCGIGAAGGGLPFMCFDLGGGANIAGSNVMVGTQGSQLNFLSQAGYEKLGLPASMVPTIANQADQIDIQFGLAFHSDSAFLRGMISKTTVETRALVNGAIIPARSANDTSTNPHNPMYGIAKAGASGDLLTLIGSRNSDSGGRSVAPAEMIDPSIRPTQVSSPGDATSLVDTGDLGTLMPDTAEAGRVMEAIEKISKDRLIDQADKLSTAAIGSAGISVQDLAHCSYLKTTNTVSEFGNIAAFDPLQDENIVPVFEGTTTAPTEQTNMAAIADDLVEGQSIFTANEVNNDSMLRKTASVMKLVLNGLAGAGTIEQGGYDYHTGNRRVGEVRDFRAGQCIGAALEYAFRTGSELMLYVFSDGSVASNGQTGDGDTLAGDNILNARGKPQWTGDNSSTAASFFLYINPAATARPAALNNQIGYFRSSGSVETNGTTPGANSVAGLVEMVILNYMSLNKNLSQFPTFFPNNRLGIQSVADINSTFVSAMLGLNTPQT